MHPLKSSWSFYVHHPMDSDWSFESYRKIIEMKNLEDIILFFKALPSSILEHYMVFIMRNDIKPLWEAEENRTGGSFSTKLEKGKIKPSIYTLFSKLAGETIINDDSIRNKMNGISISPKKNCCILKLWMKDHETYNMNILECVQPNKDKIIFKKHHIQ